MLILPVSFVFTVGMLGFAGCRPRGMPEEQASQVFRRYVLGPIPASVKNIKADQPGQLYGKWYALRFNINREDLNLIINSRPFIKVRNVRYKNGSLDWGWGRLDLGDMVIPEGGPLDTPKYNLGISLYGRRRAPAWFRPDLWDDTEAYGFYRINDLVNTEAYEYQMQKSSGLRSGRKMIQILIYNEKEQEAYFAAVDAPLDAYAAASGPQGVQALRLRSGSGSTAGLHTRIFCILKGTSAERGYEHG